MTITEDSLIIYDEKVVFQKNKTLKLKKNLKYSAPRCPLEPFVYNKYVHNENLCVVSCIHFYLMERNRITRKSKPYDNIWEAPLNFIIKYSIKMG